MHCRRSRNTWPPLHIPPPPSFFPAAGPATLSAGGCRKGSGRRCGSGRPRRPLSPPPLLRLLHHPPRQLLTPPPLLLSHRKSSKAGSNRSNRVSCGPWRHHCLRRARGGPSGWPCTGRHTSCCRCVYRQRGGGGGEEKRGGEGRRGGDKFFRTYLEVAGGWYVTRGLLTVIAEAPIVYCYVLPQGFDEREYFNASYSDLLRRVPDAERQGKA